MAENLAAHTAFRCRTIIEVLGKPKEHIEKTLKLYVEKIKKDEQYVVLNESIVDAEEQEEGDLWSAYAELEIVAKGLDSLTRFCFDYMPSSLEIVKPEKSEITSQLLAGLFNDLQSRLHNVDMIVKQQKNENDFLKKNLHIALKNSIMLSLTKPMTLDFLCKRSGMDEKEIARFIEELTKEGKITKDGELYSRKSEKGETQEES